MAYTFDPADVRSLRSRHGTKALEIVDDLALTNASMLADVTEVRARYPEHAAALIETVRCRRRARGRLRYSSEILTTEEALQQATTSVVAAHRARQIADRFDSPVVHDITCSIGAELLELTAEPRIGAVIGSDLDPVRLLMAQHNTALGAVRGPTLLRADALTPTSRADVIIADPARRSGAGRVFRLDQLTPPLLDVMMTYSGRPLIVKCAPGLDYQLLRDRYGFTGEVVVTSLDSAVREACLWSGPGLADGRRATVLRTGADGKVSEYEVTDTEPDDVVVDAPGSWILDPDGAVVRAGLVRQYAHRHGLWQLDAQIAYLTGDSVPAGERGFKIIQRVESTGDKALRKALAAYDCGVLEILVRGLDVDPDALRKRLKLKGTRSLALILTRIGRKGVAFVCEAGVRA